MIYNFTELCYGEFMSSILMQGPGIDENTLLKLIDEYERQWSDYIYNVREKIDEEDMYGHEEKVEKIVNKKIRESFNDSKYFVLKDFEDHTTFALNMLIDKHSFEKIKCTQVCIGE